jgi:hypothetical protein
VVKIFLSHINEERALALKIKEHIQNTFPDAVSVFVSSDIRDIPAGVPWKDRIRKAIEDCSLVIVLASPASLGRPWVNFEAGGAWFKGLELLAICHSGQHKSQLPPPLNDFQAVELGDPSVVTALMDSIAVRLGSTRAPRVDHAGILKELLEVAASSAPGRNESTKAGRPPETNDLEEVEVNILHALSELDDEDASVVENLASRLEVKPQKMLYHLERLMERQLVFNRIIGLEPTRYFLKKGGRELLVRRKLL